MQQIRGGVVVLDCEIARGVHQHSQWDRAKVNIAPVDFAGVHDELFWPIGLPFVLQPINDELLV